MSWTVIHPSDPGHEKPKPNDHVREAQNLLFANPWKENYRPGPQDGLLGLNFWHAVERAKKAMGYTEADSKRWVFGPRLHDYLTKLKPLPQDYEQRRDHHLREIAKHDPIRRAMVAVCRWAIRHEPEIHYSQRRPVLLPDEWRGQHARLVQQNTVPKFLQQTDCSGSTMQFAFLAGAPDPNGFSYNGLGYTGTIAGHARQVGRHEILPGDIVIFGINPTHHAAVVIELGDDPLLESHGMERGPLEIRLSAEAAYHAGQGGYRFYSLLDGPGA